ncbi:hypothetical protein LCGC14_2694240 [marine sediment metagenome]|uniref:Uncharacterized protein n=1 Tax=marine sediment metagenome TaxID=412755 RepID=A0A0F8ZHK6_9ZZZZ
MLMFILAKKQVKNGVLIVFQKKRKNVYNLILTKNIEKIKVADVYADGGLPWFKLSPIPIVVEIETKLTKKHKIDLMEFHEKRTLYIIELRGISMDIQKMEKQIRHILGM